MDDSARTFFVTSVTWQRLPIFRVESRARLLIEVLLGYRDQGKYLLHEFVVMPDHIHLLITPSVEISLERAVQFIKGGFSFRAGKELGMRSSIWQKGFSDVRITEPEEFLQVRAYIRNNPVARNLVADPQNYPYSSAHPGFELDAVPQGLQNQAGALNLAG